MYVPLNSLQDMCLSQFTIKHVRPSQFTVRRVCRSQFTIRLVSLSIYYKTCVSLSIYYKTCVSPSIARGWWGRANAHTKIWSDNTFSTIMYACERQEECEEVFKSVRMNFNFVTRLTQRRSHILDLSLPKAELVLTILSGFFFFFPSESQFIMLERLLPQLAISVHEYLR